MNIENLNIMGDYFDGLDRGSSLNMRQYPCCALGHSIRFLDKQKGHWNFQWVRGSSERLFGFSEFSRTGQFLFGQDWINNPKACGERFRYVARHGDAPSGDQWERFQFPSRQVIAEVDEAEETEDEELVLV